MPSHRLWYAMVALALLVAAPAMATAGDGVLSKAAYERAMRAIAARFHPAETTAALPVTKNLVRTATQMQKQARLFRQEAAALAALHTPVEVSADQHVLIAFDLAVARQDEAMAAWLLQSNAAGKPHGPAPTLAPDWLAKTFRATDDLRSKGYRIGDFTGG